MWIWVQFSLPFYNNNNKAFSSKQVGVG
uniref:Uncharacterized protein n=1 Tax=Arundo donax TaxID=35708 RepID=A0A0A9GZS4_ARUDO